MSAAHKFKNRQQVQDAKVVPGKAQRALKAGPHGAIKNADGTSQATPNKHGITRGYPTKDEQ